MEEIHVNKQEYLKRLSIFAFYKSNTKHFMIKKGLLAIALLMAGYAQAQEVAPYTPGTLGEGVVYYLPKTQIEVQVTASKVSYTPGELCQYANR